MANALVQSRAGGHASGTSSATTSAVGYTSNTTAGNLLVLIAYAIGSSSNNGTAPSISTPVTSGFTWTLAKSANYGDSGIFEGGRASIYYIENASAMSSAVTTTVAASKTGSSPSVTVEFDLYEFSGIATVSSLETSANAINGAPGIPSTANLSTSNTDLIISAYQAEPTGNLTAGSGYTLGINASFATNGQMQYILNQAAGSVNTAWGSSAGMWGCAAVAFKQGSVSGTATPSGVSFASAEHAPTPLQTEFARPSGVTATFAVGTVTIHAGSSVSVQGVTATFAEGITRPIASSNVSVQGVSASFATGAAIGVAGATGAVVVTGVHASFNIGAATASASTTVSVTGVIAHFAVGNAIGTTNTYQQITGGAFQDCAGNPIANGSVTFKLNTDASVGKFQINSGRVVTIPLDSTGNVSGLAYVWPNDQMTPATVYLMKVYTSNGQKVLDTQVTVPSTLGAFDLGDLVLANV